MKLSAFTQWRFLALGLLSLFFSLSPLKAQTLFWDSWNFTDNTYTGGFGTWDNVTTNWRNNGNTTNVVWTNGNIASFQVYRGSVNLNTAETLTGLQFTNNNGGYRIFGTGTITLSGGASAINLAADGFSARVENNLTLTAASTFTNSAGGVLYVTGNVTSTNLGLTIAGSGETDLNGIVALGNGVLTMNTNATGSLQLTGANTYTGGTVIDNGLVRAENATALGTGAVTLTAGTLEIDNVTIGNNITAATGTTIAGTGTAQSNGTITLAAGGAYTINSGTSVSDTLTLGNANNHLTGGNAATAITVNGSGTVVLGSGAQVSNNNLGNWTLNSGTLQIGADLLLGNAANDVTLNGGTLSTTANITLNAGRVLTFGASGGTLETATGTTLTSGTAAQLSGSGDLTVAGAGTFSVTQNSNAAYTGAVTVNNGTMILQGTNGSMTGATSWTVNADGILSLSDNGGTNASRIGDTVGITLQAGTLNYLDSAAGSPTETVGSLTLNAGDSVVNVTRNGGSSSQITFGNNPGLIRNAGATVNFTNTGGTLGTAGNNPRVIFTTNPGLTNGLIGGWAYVNNTDFAGYTAANGVETYGGARTNQINTSVAASNVLANAAQANLTANRTINSLLYNGAFNTNLGGFALDIGTGGLMKTGNNALTISNGNLTAGSAAGAELFANIVANTTTISADIVDNAGGAVDLVKAGPGTLVLSGTTANTYSGTTYVNEGEVQLNKTAGVNAIAGNVTVGDGAGTDTLQLLASNQIADTSVVTVARSGVFDLNGNNETIGGLTMEGGTGAGLGTVTTGAGTLTLAGDVALNANAQSLVSATITGNLSLGGATRTFTIADNNQVTRDMDISAVISDGASSSGLTKAGAGQLTLSGTNANTYSGMTTVNAGTLELNKTAGVNAVAGNITINTGGTLLLAASNQIADTSNMILGGGTFSTGGNSETLNNLTLTANSVIDMGAGASILKFSSTWTPGGNNLTIANWTGLVQGGGTDQIFFGNSQTLTTTQLGGITFLGYAPGAQQLSTGEIVPVIPEVATAVAALLLLGVVGWRERRKLAPRFFAR